MMRLHAAATANVQRFYLSAEMHSARSALNICFEYGMRLKYTANGALYHGTNVLHISAMLKSTIGCIFQPHAVFKT